MEPSLKARWVDALRGGTYAQGKGRLRDGDRFCCLGVLCDVAGDGRWEGGLLFVHDDGNPDTGVHSTYVPGTLRKKLGLDFATQSQLTRFNDGGSDFAAIADWIEENL